MRSGCPGSEGRVAAVFGGVDRREQRQKLASSPPPVVVIATPGRLLDLIGQPSSFERGREGGCVGEGVSTAESNPELLVDTVEYLVIDEADKMLSMGLSEQVPLLCCAYVNPVRSVRVSMSCLGCSWCL